jgi:hypothetical protein
MESQPNHLAKARLTIFWSFNVFLVRSYVFLHGTRQQINTSETYVATSASKCSNHSIFCQGVLKLAGGGKTKEHQTIHFAKIRLNVEKTTILTTNDQKLSR